MIVLAPSPAVRQLGPSLYSCSHTERGEEEEEKEESERVKLPGDQLSCT